MVLLPPSSWSLFGLACFSYGLGSIPFGLVLTRFFTHKDLRAHGSGNIGATNVLRTGSKKLAAATLLLDALKGSMAVFLAHDLTSASQHADAMCLCAVMAILGHCFSLFLKGHGGKGVATGFGALALLTPQTALCGVIIWVLTVKATHISSLGALTAYIMMPFLYGILHGLDHIEWTLIFITSLILCRHHDNIRRLLKSKEN